MQEYHVYGIGNALVDMEFAVDDDFLASVGIDKGVMTLMDEARQHQIISAIQAKPERQCSGGSAANTIIAISQFGGKCFYSCKIADDPTGHFYLKDLRNAHVDTNIHNHLEPGTSGKCLVLVTPDAERTLNTYLGISADVSRKEVDAKAIQRSQYVYLEGYLSSSSNSADAAQYAKEIAEQAKVKTALTLSDPNMVRFFREGLEQMIGSGVDLLFANKQEALMWTNSDTLDKAIEQIKTQANTFVITLGSEGAMAYDGRQLHKIEAQPIKAIDTNGAGDMFAGGFLYGITHGLNFADAGALASRAAATLITEYGARLTQAQHHDILNGHQAAIA